MKNKITKLYKKRENAYKILLECDIEIDKLLKILYGTLHTKGSKKTIKRK